MVKNTCKSLVFSIFFIYFAFNKDKELMNTTTYNASVNRYWDMLKDLGVDSKLALIHRLNDSIVLSARTRKKESTLSQCFGAWATDASYSSDQLLHDIDKVCEDEIRHIE